MNIKVNVIEMEQDCNIRKRESPVETLYTEREREHQLIAMDQEEEEEETL